jgi:hypothetical protein
MIPRRSASHLNDASDREAGQAAAVRWQRHRSLDQGAAAALRKVRRTHRLLSQPRGIGLGGSWVCRRAQLAGLASTCASRDAEPRNPCCRVGNESVVPPRAAAGAHRCWMAARRDRPDSRGAPSGAGQGLIHALSASSCAGENSNVIPAGAASAAKHLISNRCAHSRRPIDPTAIGIASAHLRVTALQACEVDRCP